jgi:F-type H+-transporting ATPase subunit delta
VSGAPRALARRYARALLDVAAGQGRDATLALRDELRTLSALVSGHAELQQALRHPGLGGERRRRVLAAVAETAGSTTLVRRLVDLLAARDRLGHLPDVADAYAEAANGAHGVVSAEAASAVPLGDTQRRALAAALGETVELRTRVEPALVGGVLVRVGGRTYDGTVRARLSALRRRLAAAGPGVPAGTSPGSARTG